ncbi:MAG: DNA-3-methyladenine glycosylase 1 [Chlamydiia bacterium]|nr:DNA-3-methyladenine glycosylase 1 [Chlamydiia bacterium]
MGNKRCFGDGKLFYEEYHDREWGVPSRDDRHLFEMLVLEGAQAGLSWETILKRRERYRASYYQFNPVKVAAMSDGELEELIASGPLIRNRRKVFAARQNAKVFLAIQEEFGSFANYLWAYVDGKPIKNDWKVASQVPAETELSKKLSKDLKRRGMTFVGPTIMYAYMQSVGLVNDHLTTCLSY